MTDMQQALHNLRRLVDVETPEDAARLDAPEALAAGAAYYASMGWPVFPVEQGGKVPLVKDWPNRATCEASTVAAWWRGSPQANIGVATGAVFDVLDVDAPAGFESLAELRAVWNEQGTPMPDCLAVVLTGSAGRHLYIPVHPTASGNGTAFAPGLDYRGKGGYVLAPPSRLTNGDRYRWLIQPRALAGVA